MPLQLTEKIYIALKYLTGPLRSLIADSLRIEILPVTLTRAMLLIFSGSEKNFYEMLIRKKLARVYFCVPTTPEGWGGRQKLSSNV